MLNVFFQVTCQKRGKEIYEMSVLFYLGGKIFHILFHLGGNVKIRPFE